MNLFTEIRNVAKSDYYGNPYEGIAFGKTWDYAKAWAEFRLRFNSQPTRHMGQHQPLPGNYLRHMDAEQVRKEVSDGY